MICCFVITTMQSKRFRGKMAGLLESYSCFFHKYFIYKNVDYFQATAEQVMEFASRAGEIRYLRMGIEKDGIKNALIEFCEQPTIIEALQLHDEEFMGREIK